LQCAERMVQMPDKITLIVRFKLQEATKAEFVSRLREVFAHIEREEAFVEASLQQDLDDPTSILIYEVWRETPESFMKNQMTREYRKGFEQAIVDLRVERTPSWYTSLAEWKRA
jgi:quinol monooxygenase YgiN